MKAIIVCLLLLPVSVYCQLPGTQLIDSLLTGYYAQYKNYATETKYKEFEGKLLEYLAGGITLNDSLPALSKSISIAGSADKQVKFYSCRDFSVTCRQYIVYAQYLTPEGKTKAERITPDVPLDEGMVGEEWVSKIYKVEEAKLDSIKHYIAFGTCCMSNRADINTIQVFSLTPDKIKRCMTCLEGKSYIALKYFKVASAVNEITEDVFKLQYEAAANEVLFNELKTDENGVAYRPGVFTGNRAKITLKKEPYKGALKVTLKEEKKK